LRFPDAQWRAADDRPWGGCDPPGVVYVYAPDRKSERPITHLAGFKGILQVDGYAGYRKLADRGDVRLAFCWSHVRRGFYELAASGPDRSPAKRSNVFLGSTSSRKTSGAEVPRNAERSDPLKAVP
jgi:transposase